MVPEATDVINEYKITMETFHLGRCVVLIMCWSIQQGIHSHVMDDLMSYNSTKADVIMYSDGTRDDMTSPSSRVLHSNASLSTLAWKEDVTVMDKIHSFTPHDKTNETDDLGLSVTSSGVTSSCRLASINSSSYELVRYLIDQEHVKLIEYHIDFLGMPIDLTTPDSLTSKTRCSWDVDHSVFSQSRDLVASRWLRVSGGHGMALLSLGFNFKVMSTMTLAVGVESVHVTITDQPSGCYDELDMCHRLSAILHLLHRDLQDGQLTASIKNYERICHQVIVNQSGVAIFTNRCCFEDQLTGLPVCHLVDQGANRWLTLLSATLVVVRISAFIFSPLLFALALKNTIQERHRYVVNVKHRPLVTSALLVRRERNVQSDDIAETANQRSKQERRIIDLTTLRSGEFQTLRRSLRKVDAEPEIISTSPPKSTGPRRISILITQYCLNIDYSKLVPENSIPIGFWRCLCDALFACHLSRIAPFEMCCKTDLFRVCRRRSTFGTQWRRQHRTEVMSHSSSVVALPHMELVVDGSGGNTFEMTTRGDQIGDRSVAVDAEADQHTDDEYCQRTQVIVSDFARSESKAETNITWHNVFKLISLTTVLVFLIPAPFFVRLTIYCVFEQREIIERKSSISQLGLRESFNFQLLHYLTPTHPSLLILYIYYFIVVIYVIASRVRRLQPSSHLDHDTPSAHQTLPTPSLFPVVVQSSLADVLDVSWMDAIRIVVANAVWPYERFGLCGIPLGIIYLPLVVPTTSLLVIVYCSPIVHVLVASVRHTAALVHHRHSHRQTGVHLLPINIDLHPSSEETLSDSGGRKTTTGVFEVDSLLSRCSLGDVQVESDEVDDDDLERDAPELEDMVESAKRRKLSYFAFADGNSDDNTTSPSNTVGKSFLRSMSSTVTSSRGIQILFPVLGCIVYVGAVIGVSLLLSECVGFVAELCALTAMGVFANPEQMMKYLAVILVVTIYIRDCFMAVHSRFLKLNRAVFAELKSRIPDLENVTSLPSYIQQNTAFKPLRRRKLHEASAAAVVEDTDSAKVSSSNMSFFDSGEESVPDTLTSRETISSLAMFVDRNDKPMIPRQLFDQICAIRAAGAPGPVYEAYLDAIYRFLRLLLFVFFIFVVILSFGEAFRVSSANQTLATLAGGLLPIALRTLRKKKEHTSGNGGGNDVADLSTLSFRCRLDEILANFRQSWPPICDFEFELESRTRAHSCSTVDDRNKLRYAMTVNISSSTNEGELNCISGKTIANVGPPFPVETNSRFSYYDNLRTKKDGNCVEFVIKC